MIKKNKLLYKIQLKELLSELVQQYSIVFKILNLSITEIYVIMIKIINNFDILNQFYQEEITSDINPLKEVLVDNNKQIVNQFVLEEQLKKELIQDAKLYKKYKAKIKNKVRFSNNKDKEEEIDTENNNKPYNITDREIENVKNQVTDRALEFFNKMLNLVLKPSKEEESVEIIKNVVSYYKNEEENYFQQEENRNSTSSEDEYLNSQSNNAIITEEKDLFDNLKPNYIYVVKNKQTTSDKIPLWYKAINIIVILLFFVFFHSVMLFMEPSSVSSIMKFFKREFNLVNNCTDHFLEINSYVEINNWISNCLADAVIRRMEYDEVGDTYLRLKEVFFELEDFSLSECNTTTNLNYITQNQPFCFGDQADSRELRKLLFDINEITLNYGFYDHQLGLIDTLFVSKSRLSHPYTYHIYNIKEMESFQVMIDNVLDYRSNKMTTKTGKYERGMRLTKIQSYMLGIFSMISGNINESESSENESNNENILILKPLNKDNAEFVLPATKNLYIKIILESSDRKYFGLGIYKYEVSDSGIVKTSYEFDGCVNPNYENESVHNISRHNKIDWTQDSGFFFKQEYKIYFNVLEVISFIIIIILNYYYTNFISFSKNVKISVFLYVTIVIYVFMYIYIFAISIMGNTDISDIDQGYSLQTIDLQMNYNNNIQIFRGFIILSIGFYLIL